MAIEEVINVLPGELVSKVEFLVIFIQALGGLIFIYLVLSVVRFFMLRKQNKIIDEIKQDVRYIKNKLKNK